MTIYIYIYIYDTGFFCFLKIFHKRTLNTCGLFIFLMFFFGGAALRQFPPRHYLQVAHLERLEVLCRFLTSTFLSRYEQIAEEAEVPL